MPKEKKKVKPVHEIRIGRLVAAIWQNETEGGAIRHNVTFSRLFKPEGEEWQNSSSFGRDDLLLLAKLADRVHSWIYDQTKEQNGSAKDQNGSANKEPEQF